MCLILVREPNVKLDYANIEAAAQNNPDGWGYVIPDRGKLEIRRFFSPKGNDPDEVYGVLDENPDKRIFMHLRFCTHGTRDKNNVHPFPALSQRKDGMQVWLMHNGTIGHYKGTDNFSDTYHFTNQVVSPVLRRLLPFNGKKGLLKDPFLPQIIDKFANDWSKFVLVDNYGNFQIIGDGVQKEGYWISNDYSFKPKYRSPPSTKNYPTIYRGHSYAPGSAQPNVVDVEYEDVYGKGYSSPFYPSVTDTCTTTTKPSTTSTSPEPKHPIVIKTQEEVDEEIEVAERTKFVELLGLDDLKDLQSLTEEDIHGMIVEFPEIMAVLVQDLLLELDNDRKS